ncbi:MAG: hypothetical protein KDK41_14905 [Leptospiraceae bacterium]|nr:hypothetical protein [Leptospiraceae bacterium]
MSEVKEKLIELIKVQPEDANAEEILKEIAFSNMVDRGIQDSLQSNTISNQKMEKRIRSKWK